MVRVVYMDIIFIQLLLAQNTIIADDAYKHAYILARSFVFDGCDGAENHPNFIRNHASERKLCVRRVREICVEINFVARKGSDGPGAAA